MCSGRPLQDVTRRRCVHGAGWLQDALDQREAIALNLAQNSDIGAFDGIANLGRYATAHPLIHAAQCEVRCKPSSLRFVAQWLESFVTDDKLFCVYIADSPETVREHAQAGGFPCNQISRVRTMIDPTTAEELVAS